MRTSYPIFSETHYSLEKIKFIIAPVKINIDRGVLSVLSKYDIQLLMFQINPVMRGRNRQPDLSQLKNQYVKFNDPEWAKKLSLNTILTKIQKTNNLLLWILNKIEGKLGDTIKPEINRFSKLIQDHPELVGQTWRENLLSWEAKHAKNYYTIVKQVLEAYDWDFIKRSRRPALDEFNSMLNYGYAILKSNIEKILLAMDFDIYVGFFHTQRPGRDSLTLDVMELFRHEIVDKAVFELIISKKIQKNHFTRQDNMISLGEIAKTQLITAINNKLFYNPDPAIASIIDECEKIYGEIMR